MPQTASQRNRQSLTRPQPMPRPATSPDFAETEDQVFGLVSVLYHSLQGAQACEQYTDDAERAGDEELVRFFEDCQRAQNERAQRAKQLLLERTDTMAEEDEDDGDQGDEEA
jgi:hypothetical protein